jgi:hypothetical protein
VWRFSKLIYVDDNLALIPNCYAPLPPGLVVASGPWVLVEIGKHPNLRKNTR